MRPAPVWLWFGSAFLSLAIAVNLSQREVRACCFHVVRFALGISAHSPAIRKEKVTPSGTPADKKPINNGTAEQEQNGVTMPKLAAKLFPTPRRLPANKERVRSGEKKV